MENRTALSLEPAQNCECAASVWGEGFFYVPTPEVTAGGAFEPPILYNMPQHTYPSPA